MLKSLVAKYRHVSRKNRKHLFMNAFTIDEHTRILDLGSEDGRAIHEVLDGLIYTAKNIHIADIDSDAVKRGEKFYGFTPVSIGENNMLPFKDGYFDIVFCSSVIEHVTVPKQSIYELSSNCEFRIKAYRHQQEFAREISRVGKQYFVQTPNRWFLFESHTWLPFIGWFSHRVQIVLIRFVNLFWIKTTIPDFNLLDREEFASLFPEAEIVPETSLGMVKSWIVVKKSSDGLL